MIWWLVDRERLNKARARRALELGSCRMEFEPCDGEWKVAQRNGTSTVIIFTGISAGGPLDIEKLMGCSLLVIGQFAGYTFLLFDIFMRLKNWFTRGSASVPFFLLPSGSTFCFQLKIVFLRGSFIIQHLRKEILHELY